MDRRERLTGEILQPIVRAALGNQTAEVLGYEAELLNGNWIAPSRTVVRLFGTASVAGTGAVTHNATATGNGTRTQKVPWSLILKVPPPIPENFGEEQREVKLYEEYTIGRLPGRFRVPTCYAITHPEDDEPWIWLEVVQGRTLRGGSLSEVCEAIRAFGETQAMQIQSGEPPLIELEGFDIGLEEQCRSTAEWGGDWLTRAEGDARLAGAFGDQRTVSSIRAAIHQSGPLAKWLLSLPRTLCHGDFHRRNIMWDENNNCWALIDWAFGGSAAPGRDVANIIEECVSSRDASLGSEKEVARAFAQAYAEGIATGGMPQLADTARVAALLIRGLTGTLGRLHAIGTVLTEPESWMIGHYGLPAEQVAGILLDDLRSCLGTLEDALTELDAVC